jgi:DNA primase
MIDQATVERIFDAAEITDVVQDYVTLKKRGVNYLGLCPFHNEKTPSFTVSPAKGIYKCFGCGKGGNSVNFIMEHEHLSYHEALLYLAKKYHIEVIEKELSPDEAKQKNETESLLIISTYAQQYFSDMLHKHAEGKAIGMSYFMERGFREDIIEKFQLGYSLEQRDAFSKEALKRGYKIEYLVKTGLTIEGENSPFDRFSGRVMFPIHGISGRVVGFGGRVLKTDKKMAKYLNSPESEIYHKSKVLYGLFFAKKSIVQNDTCYMVEGYTDVISMHQAGIENVVSSSGTSLTVDQIRLIKRFTNNITILYDGDSAGIKASIRGIDLVLEEGLNVKVLLLPDGDDPDSFSRKHSASEFNEYIKQNQSDFIVFKTRLLMEETENDPVKRAGLISDIVKSIAVINDSIVRTVYIKECSALLSVDEQVLHSEINNIRKSRTEQKYGSARLPTEGEVKQPLIQKTYLRNDTEALEKEIIRLLLKYGNNTLFSIKNPENEDEPPRIITVGSFIINEMVSDELELANALYQLIFEEIQSQIAQNKNINEKYFINHPDHEIAGLVADMLIVNHTLSKIWKRQGSSVETEEMKLESIVPETIVSYKNKKIMIMLHEAQLALLKAQQNKNQEEIEEMTERVMRLNDLKKALAITLNHRIIIE